MKLNRFVMILRSLLKKIPGLSGLRRIRLTGISTPVAGASWEYKEPEERDGGKVSQSASGAGRDIYQAGGDIRIEQPTKPPQQALPWTERAGGPCFRLFPGIYKNELLCEFRVEGSPPPGGIEARWSGAGTSHDWTMPMPENVPSGAAYRKYQLKAVPMSPMPPRDSVTFEVRFNLEDGLHGGRWIWPIIQHPKGHWVLLAHEGSGVFQPREEDTW